MIDEKNLIEALWKRHREIQNNDDDYSNEEAEIICAEICNVVSIIDEQPKADWIPCEERLPKALEDVLVWCEGIMLGGTSVGERCQTYGLGYCLKGKWVVTHTKYMKNDKVIAWRPLPQPYKKEGAE